MIERWYSTIELPLTFEQFKRLPQNPAYKWEYFGGRAVLSPRPKTYHALLDLRSFRPPAAAPDAGEEVAIRPLADGDWQQLPRVFAAAFYRVQPFASLTDEVSLEAAQACLEATREGSEGPLIGEACLVAARASDAAPVGALVTTLTPAGDPLEWRSFRWAAPPPPDAVARRLGRPHLTWVFVAPLFARCGVGTSLLAVATDALTRLGYSELASSFLLGNESSTLWHWQAGFRLLSYPGSMRVTRREARLPSGGSDKS